MNAFYVIMSVNPSRGEKIQMEIINLSTLNVTEVLDIKIRLVIREIVPGEEKGLNGLIFNLTSPRNKTCASWANI